MTAFDWSKFALGGAERPDSFSGMAPEFRDSLMQMFENAPPDVQANLRVYSGYRSPETQTKLWNDALQKYGSPDVARKWVAPPGHSNHNRGDAADLRFLDPAALSWAHQHAGDFGLAFPLKNENWHIEPAGLRGGGTPAVAPTASVPTVAADSSPSGLAAAAPQVSAEKAPAQAPSGLGSVFASLAPAAQAMSGSTGSGQGGAPAEMVGTGDPMGGANAAAAAAQKAKGLAKGLAPNVEMLMSLGKLPGMG